MLCLTGWRTKLPQGSETLILRLRRLFTLLKVDHIGIATRSIVEGLAVWRDALGLEVDATEEVTEQGVRVCMLAVGDTHVELLEPLSAETAVGKFLAKRGPGMHHIAIEVADINASLAELKNKGARLIDETPRVGAGGCLVAFVHPSSVNGVLLELVQHQSLERKVF
ncbi:MAG TPA: methylmalonyl-CoA epimerase [Pyrinomonadaceae bacterium]